MERGDIIKAFILGIGFVGGLTAVFNIFLFKKKRDEELKNYHKYQKFGSLNSNKQEIIAYLESQRLIKGGEVNKQDDETLVMIKGQLAFSEEKKDRKEGREVAIEKLCEMYRNGRIR